MQYNVPSQSGKRFFITGANTGIGRVTALELARAGAASVILAGRSRERTQPVVDEINASSKGGENVASFLELDLSDLESVRTCASRYAEEFASQGPLDVLINNAGLAGKKGLTKQGFEMAFGVNHLGHFLLTMELWPHLAEDARVVHVASRAHSRVSKLDLDAMQQSATTPTAFPEYSTSKLANVLFSHELARRTSRTGKGSYALHPGVVASDVWREVPGPIRWLMTRFMISNEEGAMTTLYCATSPEVESGKYYDACKEKKTSKLGRDDALAQELWERSVAWSGAVVPEELG